MYVYNYEFNVSITFSESYIIVSSPLTEVSDLDRSLKSISDGLGSSYIVRSKCFRSARKNARVRKVGKADVNMIGPVVRRERQEVRKSARYRPHRSYAQYRDSTDETLPNPDRTGRATYKQ